MVAVEIDGVELRGAVREAAGVEVRLYAVSQTHCHRRKSADNPYLESSDGKDQVRRLHHILCLARIRPLAGVETAIVAVLFIDGALAHGCDERGQVGLFDEIMDLLEDAVADSAGIHEDYRPLGLAQTPDHDIDDVVLLFRVVAWLRKVNRLLQPSPLDLGLDAIGRQHDVDGARPDPTLTQSIVDLVGNLGRIVELGDVAGDLRAHVGEDVEVAVAEGVVQEHAVPLGDGGGAADDMDDGNVLGEGTGDAIDGGELADAEGGDEGGDALDAGVTVGGISWIGVRAGWSKEVWDTYVGSLTSVELIDAADPGQVTRREIVECDEVVVARDAMNGTDTELVQAGEEILGHVDGLLEALHAELCHGDGCVA